MPRVYRALSTTQERSRATQLRLMNATVAVLNEHGLEGATLPRIAKAAGVSPAIVYRRFPDKIALLEAVVMHVYDRQASALQAHAAAGKADKMPLDRFASTLVRQLIESYRRSGGLLRAIRQFVHRSRHARFKKLVMSREIATFNYLVDRVLDAALTSGRRPTRQTAALAVFMVVNALLDLIVVTGRDSAWAAVLPGDDEAMGKAVADLLTRAL
jgi:AcrR family transcriptional regulator